MPMLTLDLEAIVVESFATDELDAAARPRTYEPGCTLPELCGTALMARPMNTNEPGCTLPELCGGT